jgi:hypothetical protein
LNRGSYNDVGPTGLGAGQAEGKRQKEEGKRKKAKGKRQKVKGCRGAMREMGCSMKNGELEIQN